MTFQEWKQIDQLTKALTDRFGAPPQIALVLGSGLGGVAETLDQRQSMESNLLPGWPTSTVSGHVGQVHVGKIKNTRVMIMRGRVHLYEGYSPTEVVRPVRAAVSWGAQTVILTNAAGGIDPSAIPGGLMVIADQINLTGENPLAGPNDDTRGPRFPDMTGLYDPELHAHALARAEELGTKSCAGVYAGLKGPTYETPAEVRMLATLGAHAVGMSTVLEAIAARHLGAKLAGICCITNQAAGLQGTKLDHKDVQIAGEKATADLARLLTALITTIGETP
jgi:purine-nucleoside phosphorylase